MQTADAQTDILKITNQSDGLTLRTQKGAQFLLLYFYFFGIRFGFRVKAVELSPQR